METVSGVFFIGALIAGITQWIKLVTPPEVSGHWIIPIAALVGLGVALLDTHIGVQDISPAVGIVIGLSASGVIGGLEKIG